MTETVTHPHWRVTVETSGEQIVAIETEMLAGREISEADENAIRTAAHHLLAFIGDPSPAQNAPVDQNCGCDGAWDPDGCEKCTPTAPTPKEESK